MNPMSKRQKATLQWLARMHQSGEEPWSTGPLDVPAMSIYDALERRGYVTIVKNGRMSISTGRMVLNEYTVAITEDGLQAAQEETP